VRSAKIRKFLYSTQEFNYSVSLESGDHLPPPSDGHCSQLTPLVEEILKRETTWSRQSSHQRRSTVTPRLRVTHKEKIPKLISVNTRSTTKDRLTPHRNTEQRKTIEHIDTHHKTLNKTTHDRTLSKEEQERFPILDLRDELFLSKEDPNHPCPHLQVRYSSDQVSTLRFNLPTGLPEFLCIILPSQTIVNGTLRSGTVPPILESLDRPETHVLLCFRQPDDLPQHTNENVRISYTSFRHDSTEQVVRCLVQIRSMLHVISVICYSIRICVCRSYDCEKVVGLGTQFFTLLEVWGGW